MKTRIILFSLALLAATIFVQCGSTSAITGSWKAPDANMRSYQKFFVAALTDNTSVRQTVEDELSKSLMELGLQTEKSIDVFPPDFRNQEIEKSDEVLKRISETGSDAILTIALIDQTSEERYIPGSGIYPVGRFGYYYSLGGHDIMAL